jgi:hypothetical protein
MAKVIVTRPRFVESDIHKGRAVPHEAQPKSLGMRRAARERHGYKELNENLAPLRRYLEGQVGRPWNAIYSEIAKNLRSTSTVQQHVRDHLTDFVELTPSPRGGRLGPRTGLYVDRRGILRRRSPSAEAEALPQAPAVRRLSPTIELRKIDGLWYEVRLAPLPTVAGAEIDAPAGWRRFREAPPERVYAAAKRQLSRRELRRHGLANDRAP